MRTLIFNESLQIGTQNARIVHFHSKIDQGLFKAGELIEAILTDDPDNVFFPQDYEVFYRYASPMSQNQRFGPKTKESEIRRLGDRLESIKERAIDLLETYIEFGDALSIHHSDHVVRRHKLFTYYLENYTI